MIRPISSLCRSLLPGTLVMLLSAVAPAAPAGGRPGGLPLHAAVKQRSAAELAQRDFMSVCPPFFLRDERGSVIDPVHGTNSDRPYSPKKTCGRCHDYPRITAGYHFQQGRDEKLSPELAAAYPWMRSPGQYGGRY